MVRSFYPWVENPADGGASPSAPGNPAGKGTDEGAIAGAERTSAGDRSNRGATGAIGLAGARAVDVHGNDHELPDFVSHEARIAVIDDPSVAPRVSIVDPAPIRDYVETITQTTYSSAREQGGSIPFMVIREVVENLIHAYFTDPVVTILPGGNTIRFSDRGPGIRSKEKALEYGTTTATEAMKRYIRGVGSGLPYVFHFLSEKGGSLTIEDNLSSGTVITMSLEPVVSRETTGDRGRATSPQPLGPALPETNEAMTRSTRRPTAQPLPSVEHQSTASLDQTPGDLHLDDSDRQILAYLHAHGSVGPTELAKTYGASLGTWSRRLSRLKTKGIVEKSGQKHYLTIVGRQVADLVGDR